MQRFGALLFSLIALAGAVTILVTIDSALSHVWTSEGVAASVFGVFVVLLVLPTSVVHGLAAIVPGLLDRWETSAHHPLEPVMTHFAVRLREWYRILGWFVVVCALVLFIYVLVM